MASTDSVRELAPESYPEAAEMLREAADGGGGVQVHGGATKIGWGRALREPFRRLSTGRLDRVIEHNQGDFTAIVQAGVRLDELQERLGASGQRVSLDPPTGADGRATIGGIAATADAGPLRHRYGTPRDLILGITVALPDGTLAKSGGKVIKNVAGYDLGKLYAGSFGTLGPILQVALRLHPLPAETATVVGRCDDPGPIAEAALGLARAPLEPEALDVRWAEGEGALLIRVTGSAAERLAARAEAVMAERGLRTEVADEAGAAWAAQRDGQRAADGAVVRVSSTASRLAEVIEAARERDASLVGRAAAGVSWITLRAADDERLAAEVEGLRRRLAPAQCAVFDMPESLRAGFDVWGFDSPGEQRLMAAIKERFDPGRRCNPGLFGDPVG